MLERTGYSRSRLYARISAGLFPRPIALGPRVSAWPEHDVEALVAAHIRQVTDAELARLVASLHGQRTTFGLDAKPAASVSAVA